MTDQQTETLKDAADLLRAFPWGWQVTVEYPGFLLVTFADDDTNTRAGERYYAAGFANTTLTVDRQTAEGEHLATVDTQVHVGVLDGYRMAVHVAAAIDRLEHAGEVIL